MNTTSLSSIAVGLCIVLYLAAAWRLGRQLAHTAGRGVHTHLTYALTAGAVCAHAAVLYSAILGGGGFNLSFFNAASLIGWVIALLALCTAQSGSLYSLGVFVMPLTALLVALAQVFPGSHTTTAMTTSVRVHAAVSIIGYGSLALAALQALFVWVQDRALRTKRLGSLLRALPPLTSQETLLFQLIAIGFFFLSLSLVSGIMFVADLLQQHLAHKTVFSTLAWMVFAVLLWGRWRHGWRGRKVIQWVLVGFIALALAYFGAKMVLELLLDRRWST